MIKNLLPGLTERGKIKIGIKGEHRTTRQGKDFQLPKKLDHFVVTGMARSTKDNNFVRDESIHRIIGEAPTEIPITLLYDDIEMNFQTRYVCYKGKKLFCTGDGEKAEELNEETGKKITRGCPCKRLEKDYDGKDVCKPTGNLSVLIRGAESVGGVWKFRTTSYNSVIGILSALTLIKSQSGGRLAGLPLVLTVGPKAAINPKTNIGVTIFVVGVEYRGNVKTLKEEGYKISLNYTKLQIKTDDIEREAKTLISHERAALEVDAEDIVDEYFPEAAKESAKDETPKMAKPSGEPSGSESEGPQPQETKKKTRGRPKKTAAAKPEDEPPTLASPSQPHEETGSGEDPEPGLKPVEENKPEPQKQEESNKEPGPVAANTDGPVDIF